VKDRPPLSPTVPHRLPPSSVVFCCFPPSLTTPHRPPPSPTRICLRLWGLPSFLMTAVLELQGRGRTAFCCPVQSLSQVAQQAEMKDEEGLRFAVPSRPGLLAVPPPGPTGAPDGCEHCPPPARHQLSHPPKLQYIQIYSHSCQK